MNGWSRIAALAVAWGCAFALYVARGGFAALFFCCSVSFIFGCAILSTRLTLRRVEAVRAMPQFHCFAGDDAAVSVTVTHRSYMPLVWMVVKDVWTGPGGETFAHSKLAFPWFDRSVTFRYRIRSVRRGAYRFERTELVTGDPFGLLVRRRSVENAMTFTVYPRPLDDVAPPVGADGSGRPLPFTAAAAPASPSGVRDYAAGDPPQRIHWKATARTGALKTKTASPSTGDRLIIALDNSRFSYAEPGSAHLLETAVRAAAGLLCTAYQTGRPAGLCCPGGAVLSLPASRFADLKAGFEWLAFVRPDGCRPFAGFVERESAHWPPDSAPVLVTPNADDALIAAIRKLRARLRGVTLVLIEGAPVSGWRNRRFMKLLDEIGCAVLPIAALCDERTEGETEDVIA